MNIERQYRCIRTNQTGFTVTLGDDHDAAVTVTAGFAVAHHAISAVLYAAAARRRAGDGVQISCSVLPMSVNPFVPDGLRLQPALFVCLGEQPWRTGRAASRDLPRQDLPGTLDYACDRRSWLAVGRRLQC